MLKVKNQELKVKTDWDGSVRTVTVRHPWLRTVAHVAARVLSRDDASAFLPEPAATLDGLRAVLERHQPVVLEHGLGHDDIHTSVFLYCSRESPELQCLLHTPTGWSFVPLVDVLAIVESSLEYGVPGLSCPVCKSSTLLSDRVTQRSQDGSISGFRCPVCETLLDHRMRSVVCRGREPVRIGKAA